MSRSLSQSDSSFSEEESEEEKQPKHQYKRQKTSHAAYLVPHKELRSIEKDGNAVTHFSHFGSNQDEEREQGVSLDAQSMYSSKAAKMMKSMGYEEGMGLGKFGQGLVSPIEASKQRGRRGLGYIIKGLETDDGVQWDPSLEKIVIKEEVRWIPRHPDEPPKMEDIFDWSCEGPKKRDIASETDFCDSKVLRGVLCAKTVFDHLPDPRELIRARARSNPFETLGKLFFQNRAALKMSNMDAVFDFMFTRPVTETGESLVGPRELLYFADVCAAPGGFSEYVLWRRKTVNNKFCDAKGFGFTLKENDFRLHDFYAAPHEFFEPHYGISGVEGDGDIYVPSNIKNFRTFVLDSTGGKGVHFMMADGGFSVEGQENIQEILSKQLYLCQFTVALGIIRTGGHFVCKLFDVFTPFSVGLVYLMHRAFKDICIHKPNTSRPANSERYIICKWKRENVEDIYEYLFDINERLNGSGIQSEHDITEVVPLRILKSEKVFYEYICESNNCIGENQIIGLHKIHTFIKDTSLNEDRQAEVRTECLRYWQLPDRARTAPERKDPNLTFQELVSADSQDILNLVPEDLTVKNIEAKIRSQYDFRFVLLTSPREARKERGFFLGLGGNNIYIWNGKSIAKWVKLDVNHKLEMPPNTLVYGEIVTEYRGEMKVQRKASVFHLIDGIVLNEFYIQHLHLTERHCYLEKFAAAITKGSRDNLMPVKCKTLYRLEEIEHVLQPPRLSLRHMKGASWQRRSFLEEEATARSPPQYIIPTGVMLLKTTEAPWMMAWSNSQGRKYYFHTMTKASTFTTTAETIASFRTSYSKGVFWWWEPEGVAILEAEKHAVDKVSLTTLVEHLKKPK